MGPKTNDFHCVEKKNLILCPTEAKSCMFGTTWVNHNRIKNFGWTIPVLVFLLHFLGKRGLNWPKSRSSYWVHTQFRSEWSGFEFDNNFSQKTFLKTHTHSFILHTYIQPIVVLALIHDLLKSWQRWYGWTDEWMGDSPDGWTHGDVSIVSG